MKTLFKIIYNLIPFKLQLYSVLKIIWKPHHSVYQHLHFKGVFEVPVDKIKKFKIKHYGYEIENEIFWTGLTNGWEKESIKLWIKLCENAEIVFDIGANTGVYSLVAKAVNPNAKVYAFEPVARVFAKLQENINLNNFDIIPIEKAVSNFDGTAIIYDTDSDHTYSVTVNKNFIVPESEAIQTMVKTITLDSFVKQAKLEKVDLIKIDVETHEPEVLEGFSDCLFKFNPVILIEILNNEIGDRVNNLVKGLDYLYFNIDERGGIQQVKKITQRDYYNYLLCSSNIAKKMGLITTSD